MRCLATHRSAALVLAAALSSVVPALAQYPPRRVAPENLGAYWVRTNRYVDAQAPNSGRGLDRIGCATVTYTVGSDGRTHDVKVVRVVPATSDFQITARTLVAGLVYRAGPDNRASSPVATYFIVPFNVPAHSPQIMARVLAECRLSGYGD